MNPFVVSLAGPLAPLVCLVSFSATAQNVEAETINGSLEMQHLHTAFWQDRWDPFAANADGRIYRCQ
ncbi:MAG: hypothetical protein ACI9OJ_002227 [Myxococcota bacterium]|jgi:hypothetical protein